MSIGDFDNADDWPNIAVLRFAANEGVVEENADRVAERRTIIDLPALLLAWLAHVWVTDEQINPLAAGKGVPSAAFVEAAYSLAGIELTPGLASTASCPEAIWQAVKWWHEYYAGVAEIGAAAEAGPWCRRAGIACASVRPRCACHRTRRSSCRQPERASAEPKTKRRSRMTGSHRRYIHGRQPLRRGRRRLGIRRLCNDLPAGRSRPTSAAPGARAAVSAGQLPAQPVSASGALSGTRAKACTGCSRCGRSTTSGAVISSGLGGGSLIYANVQLRKDEKWFVREEGNGTGVEYWPVTRAGPGPALRPRGADARAQTYPFDAEPYASTPRTRVFHDGRPRPGLGAVLSAARRDVRGARPPAGHRRRRSPSRTTVETCTERHAPRAGWSGSATSAATTARRTASTTTTCREAVHEGALIRTLCEVREFEPRDGGGWVVRYVEHDLSREGESFPTSSSAKQGSDLRPADPVGRHARHGLPAFAKQESVAGLEWSARDAFLRQRRPVDPGPAPTGWRVRKANPRRGRHRSIDHVGDSVRRRAGWNARWPRLLPRGRRIPRAGQLADPGDGDAGRHPSLLAGRRAAGKALSAARERRRHRRRALAAARRCRAFGGHPSSVGHGSRAAERRHGAEGQAGSTSDGRSTARARSSSECALPRNCWQKP